jgi:hypothetical protein
MIMIDLKESANDIGYAVGQKWLNTESGIEVYITDIDETIVSLDDKRGRLSSFEHMNKSLWIHLVKTGVFKKIQ